MQTLQLRPQAPQKLRACAGRGRSSARRLVVKAAKVADGPKIAIVGVTGAVGQEFLRVRDSNTSILTALQSFQDDILHG